MADEKSYLEEFIEKVDNCCRISYANSEFDQPPEVYGEIPDKAVFVLHVSRKGWGFGEFAFAQDEDGQLYIDTECSPSILKQVINDWIDSAILDTDEDPEKHRKYNQVRGRHCGEGCKVCDEQ